MNEFTGDEKRETPAPVEIGSSGEQTFAIAELPGEDERDPVELPAESATVEKKVDPPSGFIEMDSDNSHLLERMHIGDDKGPVMTNPQGGMVPQPLNVAPGSDTGFYKETM